MNELGLAGQQVPQRNNMPSIGQVVAMLKQGANPQELVHMGIPEQIIRQAMDMISQEMTQVAPEQAGLAGMQVQGNMG